jgi:hypothetical protein
MAILIDYAARRRTLEKGRAGTFQIQKNRADISALFFCFNGLV